MITDVSKEILIKIGQLLSKTDSDVEAVLINKQNDIVCATGKKSNTDAGELLKTFLIPIGNPPTYFKK